MQREEKRQAEYLVLNKLSNELYGEGRGNGESEEQGVGLESRGNKILCTIPTQSFTF